MKAIAWAGSVTIRPAWITAPSVGICSPATMRSIVVLPQPEGPTMHTNSDWRTARFMS